MEILFAFGFSVFCFWMANKLQKAKKGGLLSFPNACNSREEYHERKNEKIKLILNDFYFWEKLETEIFLNGKKLLKNWTCPYCGEKLPERKGKTFNCSACKNKVFKKSEVITKEEGLYTKEQRDKIEAIWSEYHKRSALIEIWQYLDKIIIPEPTMPKLGNTIKSQLTDDKNKNIETLLFMLGLGLPEYYKKENLNDLRECKLYEAELQERYGTTQQATNAYMKLLYIDLMGDYCELYSDSDCDKKELKADGFKEWDNGFIAPAIYECAFKEDLSMEKFEEIFLFNANNLVETLQFKPPITPQQAWEKIKTYNP